MSKLVQIPMSYALGSSPETEMSVKLKRVSSTEDPLEAQAGSNVKRKPAEPGGSLSSPVAGMLQ